MGKLQAWIRITCFYLKHKTEEELTMLMYYDVYEACIVTLKQWSLESYICIIDLCRDIWVDLYVTRF